MDGLQQPAMTESKSVVFPTTPRDNKWSGWKDSNSQPSAPKADALRKLSYTQIALTNS